jgi:hypothetical protein
MPASGLVGGMSIGVFATLWGEAATPQRWRSPRSTGRSTARGVRRWTMEIVRGHGHDARREVADARAMVKGDGGGLSPSALTAALRCSLLPFAAPLRGDRGKGVVGAHSAPRRAQHGAGVRSICSGDPGGDHELGHEQRVPAGTDFSSRRTHRVPTTSIRLGRGARGEQVWPARDSGLVGSVARAARRLYRGFPMSLVQHAASARAMKRRLD